jgi:hypothetical protein
MDTDDDDEWRGAFLVEPLTALAGGLAGGIIVSVIAWRTIGRVLDHGTDITNPRRGAHA